MPLFDTHIVVDWSARSTPSPCKPTKDAIWWAVARDGIVAELAYCRTRHDAIARLMEMIVVERRASRRVLVGFDFPFGYPTGVAGKLAGEATAVSLWQWLAELVQDDESNANNRFDVAGEINRHYPGVGPCWGTPRYRVVADVPAKKRHRTRRAEQPAENRIADERAGAKAVWQIAYAGSVGSQALVGMPAIWRILAQPALYGRVAVWPFENGLKVPEEPVVIAEVYPSLLRDVIKAQRRPAEIHDRAQVRVNAQAFASLDAANRLEPLFAGGADLSPDERRRVVTEEGWVLGLGHEAELRDAAALPAQSVDSLAKVGADGTPSPDEARSFIGCLRGTVVSYDDPFEPAAPATDWSALGDADGRA